MTQPTDKAPIGYTAIELKEILNELIGKQLAALQERGQLTEEPDSPLAPAQATLMSLMDSLPGLLVKNNQRLIEDLKKSPLSEFLNETSARSSGDIPPLQHDE